jgi:hypothetical protein
MPDSKSNPDGKLTITVCKADAEGKVSVDANDDFDYGKTFTVMLNPASYKQNEGIKYNKQETPGQVDSTQPFHATSPKKLDFSIIIDGTGVVGDSANQDVASKIDELNEVVYKYDGSNHEPNHVRVLWGKLKFFGRLESMSIDYTLFAHGGKPLRAEIALSFVSFLTAKEEALQKKKNSPDVTHIVTIKAGDTIPRLCSRIYGNGGYYKQVARINNITNFRNIRPGATLHFPPLR